MLGLHLIMGDFSNESYAGAGVSVVAQNAENSEVKRRLSDLGSRADGLFGGAVDVSGYRGRSPVSLDVSGAHVDYSRKTMKASGRHTAEQAFKNANGEPAGVLDYIALPNMCGKVPDFVEGVTRATVQRGVMVLGGESAEMKDTYQKTRYGYDAFVHVISVRDDTQKGDISELITGMEQPLVVGSTDGTGTKTKIVKDPRDIIYHGLNDIGAMGVRPIGYALYIAGQPSAEKLWQIHDLSGRIRNELGLTEFDPIVVNKPFTYLAGEVDIAGTVLGVVDNKDLVTGEDVSVDDVIIGISVDGLMTNGYTLARRLCQKMASEYGRNANEGMDRKLDELDGLSLRESLALPHRPMTDILFGDGDVLGVLDRFPEKVYGMAHITGGGMPDNIIRMIPEGLGADVKRYVLPVPKLMQMFKDRDLPEDELFSTFNMGVGFTLTVAPGLAGAVVDYINDNFAQRIEGVDRQAAIIGRVVRRETGEKFRFVSNL
jgi:phosphoribosylformylglycinamidine cyclo-ligase